MKKKLQIGMDCDGVLFDFKDHLLRKIEKIATLEASPFETATIGGQIASMRNSDKWAFYKDAGWDEKQFFAVLRLFVEERGFENMPIRGTKAFIDNLWQHGDVSLVTSRVYDWMNLQERQSMFAQTHNWVYRNNLNFRSVIITGQKDLCQIDCILEDHYDTCIKLLKNGVVAPFLLTTPWNASCDYPFRCDTKEEFVEICAEAAKYEDPWKEFFDPMNAQGFRYIHEKGLLTPA